MIDRILGTFEKFIVTTFLAIAVFIAFILVVLRYGFGKGFTWGPEMVIILVVWASFIGAAIAVREKTHIELEVIRDLLPTFPRLIVTILADTLCLAVTLFIMIFGIKMASFLYRSQGIEVATGLPEWFIFLCVPLGGLVMSVRYFQKLVQNIRDLTAIIKTRFDKGVVQKDRTE